MPTTDNSELIQELIKKIDLSSMEDDERTMWKILLPSLEKDELEKLQTTLDEEIKAMTELYLQSKK